MSEIQCDNMRLYNSYIQNADEDDLLYSGCSVPSAHSIVDMATPHCVYRLSVRLIGRCAFSTGICVQSRDYGDVETAVSLPFVPEARHPINPTLSDYGERSVG